MTRRLGTSPSDALAAFGALPDPASAPLFARPIRHVRPTSVAAYRGADVHGRAAQVLRLLMQGDRTLDEACAVLGIEANRLSGSFTRLAKLGLIIRTGKQRLTRLNRPADVWRVAKGGS